jgi:CBS domain-containing protein
VTVGEVMTRGVEPASPTGSIQQATGRMAGLDTGVLPVGEGDRLVGMLTDRAVAVRAVAQGRDPDTRVREAMIPDVRYSFEDEDLDGVVRNMGRNKRPAGIVGPGDVALSAGKGETDAAASAAPGPGGPHARAG